MLVGEWRAQSSNCWAGSIRSRSTAAGCWRSVWSRWETPRASDSFWARNSLWISSNVASSVRRSNSSRATRCPSLPQPLDRYTFLLIEFPCFIPTFLYVNYSYLHILLILITQLHSPQLSLSAQFSQYFVSTDLSAILLKLLELGTLLCITSIFYLLMKEFCFNPEILKFLVIWPDLNKLEYFLCRNASLFWYWLLKQIFGN